MIRTFLQTTLSIETPKVLLMMNLSWRPSRNLAFNVFREDYVESDVFEAVMSRLAQWYLPPGVGLMGLPRDRAADIQHVL